MNVPQRRTHLVSAALITAALIAPAVARPAGPYRPSRGEPATPDRVDTVLGSRTRRCGDLLVASERPVALPSCPGGWHFVGAGTASTA
jgi:hypothetical protein